MPTKTRRHSNIQNKQTRSELQRLSALSDGIDEPIYVIDPNTYKVLFANSKTKEIFGKTAIGNKCYKLFQGTDRPCNSCTNRFILGKNLGKTYTSKDRKNPKNGRWYRGIYKAIKWPGGKHVKYGIAIDITNQKRFEEALKQSEERFRAISTSAKDAVVLIDEKDKISCWNPAAERIFGYTAKEALGKNFHKLVAPERAYQRYLKEYAKFRRSGRSASIGKTIEVTVTRKDGTRLPLELSVSALRIEGKWHAVGIARDILERRQMEKALQENEQLFRSIVENSHDCIIIIDEDFRIAYANDEVSRLTGYSKAEILNLDFRRLLLGKDKHAIQDEYLQSQEECMRRQCELKIVRKSGEVRDVQMRCTTTSKGGKIWSVTQLLDVTARKEMENERKKYEERLSALNHYGQNLNMTKNMEEIYRLMLDAMENTLGFEFADVFIIAGKTLLLVAHRGNARNISLKLPLDGEKGITVRVANSGKAIFVSDTRKDKGYVEGGEHTLSELAVPIKVGNKVLGVLNVESNELEAFKEEERKLLEILASHAAIAISNLRRRDKLREISGKLEHLIKNTTELMHAKRMYQKLKVISKAIGKFGWRRVVISLRDENLEGTDVVAVGLTKTETRLLMKRKAPGKVWRQRLGDEFERFKLGEFYYLPWADPWVRENVHKVPRHASIDKATTYAGVPSRLSATQMVDWHPQDMLYAPLRTPEGRIVGILSMDDPVDGYKPTREALVPLELFLHQAAMIIENAQLIESLREIREQLEQKVEERTLELKESQGQLLRAQRLAVIGELAGMVGHDLRNPLTSIAGATYYVKKQLSSRIDGKIKEMLDLVEKNIEYSNKIINDLLDYSREMKLDLTEITPRSLVMETLSLVETPRNVLVVNLTACSPKLKVDVDKLERAFVNIVRNAFEAMPNGGTLTIKSRKVHDAIEFSFKDTGTGMSKQILRKLGAPLFTTKAKGMGFGMPICKRVVEAHKGTISACSEPRKGTTFKVTLPAQPKIEGGGEEIWIKTPESSLLMMTKT